VAYLTAEDLAAQVPAHQLLELADDDGDGQADAAVLAAAIAAAEATVDGYLQARYRLPLAAVPAVLTRLARDLAVWELWSRRDTPEVEKRPVYLRWKEALRFLEKLAAGEVLLGVEPQPEQAPATARVERGPADRVFTRDSLKGF
jgi:phage gp36-like protein